MMTLADILRTAAASNLSRNQLKVARAKLRRMGLTNRNPAEKGPYAVDVHSDNATSRNDAGTIIASAAVLAV